MKSERMSKVSILCPKNTSGAVIDKLHELKVLHIQDHIKTEEIDIGTPQESAEKIAEILLKIRAVMGLLHMEPDGIGIDYKKEDFFKLGKRTRQIFDEIVKQNDIIKKADENLAKLRDMQKSLEILEGLNISKEELAESNYLARFIGSTSDSAIAKSKIRSITQRCELQTLRSHEKEYIAVFADKKYENQIKDALAISGFLAVNVNLSDVSKKTINDQLKDMQANIKENEKTKKTALKELESIKSENSEFILKNEKFLSQEAKKAEVTLRFGATQKAFIIKGWIPTKKLEEVEKELNKITGNKVHIEILDYEKGDRIPIRLKNPKPINSFEFFLDMFDLPNYREIDPTFIMFLTFPLFFGIMLGDAGYGVFTLLLFLILRWKMPSIKKMINIMIFASIMTIIFGVAYGEYFGFEHLSIETGGKLCSITGICLEKVQLQEETKTENTGEEIQKEASVEELKGNDIKNDDNAKNEESSIKTLERNQPIKGIADFSSKTKKQEHTSTETITIVKNGIVVELNSTNQLQDQESLKNGLDIESITLDQGKAQDNEKAAIMPKKEGDIEPLEDNFIEGGENEGNISAAATAGEAELKSEEPQEPVFVYDFPRITNRLHSKMNIAGFEVFTILIIGIVIGFFHLNLGLILGFINVYGKHGLMHAIEEKASWFFVQGGVILLALGYVWYLYAPIFLIGVVLLYLGEGIQGIVELPSIFSNMLSYMRLGALGLAGVGLAIVINEKLTMPFIEKGGIYIVIGILIFTIGHAINIVLGLIGPFLHSLRLHYVEFFSKFYKGGGLRYEPFGQEEEN